MENIFTQIFDAIYCIRFVKRGKLSGTIYDELKRVGIIDSPVFDVVYSVNMPQNYIYYRYMNGVEQEQHQLLERYIHVTMTHYQTIKTAYDLGLENILILEDDIVFLKDTNKIQDILKTYDKTIPITLFDYVEFNIENSENNNYNNYYHKFNAGLLSSCYALNREGMEYLMYCIENSPIYEIDKYFSNCILYFANCHNGMYQPPCDVPLVLASNTRLCLQTADEYSRYYIEAYDNDKIINNVDYTQYNLHPK